MTLRSPLTGKSRYLYPALLTAIFLLSRGLALAAGLRYSAIELVWFWQVLDFEVLHHHLVRGLIHLHGQPPLYNAFIGMALKIAPDAIGWILLGAQILLGLAATLAVYCTLIRLGLRPLIGFCIALVLMLNPAAILYEFDALYTQLVYGMLCLLAYALTCYVQMQTRRWLYAALGLGLALTLVRATYQWIWLAALCGLLWWLIPEARRRTALTSLVFIGLSLLWPLKNLVLFHHFSSSTWLPYSVGKHWKAEDPIVARWAAEGKLPTFTYSEAEGAERETEWLKTRWRAPEQGVPELDSLTKSVGGAANWNSLALLRMHEAQAKDVSFLLRHYPQPLSTDAIASIRLYFEPTSRYFLISQNEAAEQYRRLAKVTHTLDRVCCNLFGLPPDFRSDYRPADQAAPKDHSTTMQLFQRLCLGGIVLFLLVMTALASTAKWSFWKESPDRRVMTILLGWTIIWVFVVTNLVETGENMRFRFETQALAIIIASLFLQQFLDVLQGHRKLLTLGHEG